MIKHQYFWVILPYGFVIVGMLILRNAWGALIGFHVGLLPLIIHQWKVIYPSFVVTVPRRIFLFAGFVGLFAGIGFYLVWPFAGFQIGFSRRLSELGLSGSIWLPFIIYFTLVNPWLEEAYWRNALSSQSKYPAFVDFLFAGYHLVILNIFVGPAWMFFAFVILSAAGWFWRQISRYTGSLLPAVFSHLLADLSLLVAIYQFAG